MLRNLVLTMKSRLTGFGLAAAIFIGLMILSYGRSFAGSSASLALRRSVQDSLFSTALWSTALARNVVLFFLVLALLHVAAGFVCWLMARVCEYAFPTVKATRTHWILVWCCVAIAWTLIANAMLYPHSSLGAPYRVLVRKELAGMSVFVLATGLAMLALAATLAAAAVRRMREGYRPTKRGAVALAGFALVAAAAAVPNFGGSAEAAAKPHVIIIGIDSLRADETRPGGPAFAPNIARFLADSTTFADATTPLARTFPSWVSILTGRHPHTTGAVINLLPRKSLRTGDTLGDLFQRAGYRTVYGIDEVRFSNIDRTYGFDQLITPPMGASDFVLAWLGDTPLSNVIVNTRLGALLFPYVHANRPADKTYDPDQFVNRLARELEFDRPTFLAVHLTLAHWPFSWKDSIPRPSVKDEHTQAITRVDQQFADVLAALDRRGALANALVIVLSDHGESLGLSTDSLLREEHGLEDLLKIHKAPHGHGTDVLAPGQYQVVLGMRCFGTCPVELRPGRVIDAPVSLEDLAPTLTDLFALQTQDRFDGMSLRPLLESAPGAEQQFANRIRFTESEFNPPGLMTSGGRVSASAAAAAAKFYTIDPVTDRIQLDLKMLDTVLQDRQYAAFDARTLLAALPDESGAGYQLVAVDRTGATARRLTAVPGPNAYPELAGLYRMLEERFGLRPKPTPDSNAQ